MSRLAVFVLVCLAVVVLTVGPVVVSALGVPHEHQWVALMLGACVLLGLWAAWFCIVEGWP